MVIIIIIWRIHQKLVLQVLVVVFQQVVVPCFLLQQVFPSVVVVLSARRAHLWEFKRKSKNGR